MTRRRGMLSRLKSPDRAPVPVKESIAAHLEDLLNNPLGSCPCASALGVTARADLVHNFPSAARKVQRGLRSAILAFEPRLTQVHVEVASPSGPPNLEILIRGRLEGQSTSRFSITAKIDSSGRILIA